MCTAVEQTLQEGQDDEETNGEGDEVEDEEDEEDKEESNSFESSAEELTPKALHAAQNVLPRRLDSICVAIEESDRIATVPTADLTAAPFRMLRPPRPTPSHGGRVMIRVGRGHQVYVPPWYEAEEETRGQPDNDRAPTGDSPDVAGCSAATAVNAIPHWPPADKIYLDLLLTYNLRPTDLQALRRRETIEIIEQTDAHALKVDTLHYRQTLCEELKKARSDALQNPGQQTACEELKKAHSDALENPGQNAALILKIGGRIRGILLYTPHSRRCAIVMIHVHMTCRRCGHALRLIKKLQDSVPPRGFLTVDSPACTARAAVGVLISADFMPDQTLLNCTLAEDSAYIGGNSVRLSFTWTKTRDAADEQVRAQFLDQVQRKHDFLASVCGRVIARIR